MEARSLKRSREEIENVGPSENSKRRREDKTGSRLDEIRKKNLCFLTPEEQKNFDNFRNSGQKTDKVTPKEVIAAQIYHTVESQRQQSCTDSAIEEELKKIREDQQYKETYGDEGSSSHSEKGSVSLKQNQVPDTFSYHTKSGSGKYAISQVIEEQIRLLKSYQNKKDNNKMRKRNKNKSSEGNVLDIYKEHYRKYGLEKTKEMFDVGNCVGRGYKTKYDKQGVNKARVYLDRLSDYEKDAYKLFRRYAQRYKKNEARKEYQEFCQRERENSGESLEQSALSQQTHDAGQLTTNAKGYPTTGALRLASEDMQKRAEYVEWKHSQGLGDS